MGDRDFFQRAGVRLVPWLAAVALGASLAACGGGGDDDQAFVAEPSALAANQPMAARTTGPRTPPSNAWLTIAPTPIEAAAFEGASTTITVTTTSTAAPSKKPIYLRASEATGVLKLEAASAPALNWTYTLNLSTASTLQAGDHTGSFVIELCTDALCRKQVQGSPWRVPFKVTVTPRSSDLRELDGSAGWTTYQGNAAHTGHVAATVWPGLFHHRWTVPIASSSVVVQDGRVFSVQSGRFAPAVVEAFSEADGSLLWSTSMGSLFHANPPAVSNGKVFVASTGHADTAMWAFDAATGAVLAKQPMLSQWESYLAPTPYQGKVYTNSGHYGGLSAFDIATMESLWWAPLPQYDSWTPAVDDRYVYAYTGVYGVEGRLTVLNHDGTPAAAITDPAFSWAGYDMQGSPVLGANGLVFATQFGSSAGNGYFGRLLAFDVPGRTLKWSHASYYRSNPVLVKDAVLAVNYSSLEARAQATGAFLWRWVAPEGFSGEWNVSNPVVVVGNVAFVGTVTRTVAIDLTTHQPVWSYPATGPLAVSSNGVLFIASRNALVAIDLH